MHSVDNFYIVKVNELLGEGHLSLSGRLLEALSGLAASLTIISAVSLLAVASRCIAACLSSDGTAPDDVEAVVQHRNVDIPLLVGLQLEVAISRLGVDEEALADGSGLDALCPWIAITVTATLGVNRGVYVSYGATCKAKPHWLFAKVAHSHHAVFADGCAKQEG